MKNPSKMVAAATLVGFGVMLAGLSAGAVETSPTDVPAERIAAAFAVLPGEGAAGSISAASKGDLLVNGGCAGQKWPDITAACLVVTNGSPIRPVRSVTIGLQAGEATTVLVRMPAPQLASR